MENINDMEIKKIVIEKLREIWNENKAKGLLSQIRFLQDLDTQILGNHKTKYYYGCWLLAPKKKDYFKYRFSFFVHPRLEKNISDKLDLCNIMKEAEQIKFKRVAGFLNKAGVGVIYCVPVGDDIFNITWYLFRYDFKNEKLSLLNANDFFRNWEGRGRPSSSRGWSKNTETQYLQLDKNILITLYLNEHFYTEYIKREKRISISDPYDVDGFFIGYSTGTVLPVEIKEKFPAGTGTERFFGIDAGRVLMLLRLCLPNDANALYIIREVDETPRREFLGWKFITLSDIVMSSSWNLQRGGRGMGGQETQTIRLPYDSFKNLNSDILKDYHLDKIGRMPDEIKRKVKQFISDRGNLFGW